MSLTALVTTILLDDGVVEGQERVKVKSVSRAVRIRLHSNQDRRIDPGTSIIRPSDNL